MNDTREARKTCAGRWKAHKDARIRYLRKLFSAYEQGKEDKDGEDLGIVTEYGLSFDYVAPETFEEQLEGYWRYQLSWGGPSDEFRFYAGGCGEQKPYRISYVFLDWFDGHERRLVGGDLAFMRSIWAFFAETGSTHSKYRRGLER